MTKRKARRQHSRQSTAALLRNGLEAFRNGRYDEAIAVLERAERQSPPMQLAPALAQAYFRRGLRRTYGQPADPQAGLSDLERAVSLQPEDSCYAYHLGLAAHRLGDLERAIRMYDVVRQCGGEFAVRAAYPLALAMLQSGRDPASAPVWTAVSAQERAMLRQATVFRRRPYTLAPDAPPLWHGLAMLDVGDHERARTLLDGALQGAANPTEEGLAHYYLGVLAARDEQWEATCRHWIAARASGLHMPHLEGNLGEVYHRLAEERLQNGDAEGALAAGVESLRYQPGEKRLGELVSQAHQVLAYEAAFAGQWAAALEHWEAADQAEGGSFRLAYNLALAYERTEEYLAAGEKWREALRRRPRHDDHPDAVGDEQVSQLWRRAAAAYNMAGEYDEAVRVCRQAVKWNPDHIGTRMALAEMLLANGQPQAAENELGRILERDPHNVLALLRQGEVIAASGSWWPWNRPTSYWERVLELEPDNAAARQLLADFYQDEADYYLSARAYERAVELYRKALGYQPNSGRILAALGGCYVRMGQQAIAQDYVEQALAAAPRDLVVYDQIIHAWLDIDEPGRAWEVMGRAEASGEVIPCGFYISQAHHCIRRRGDLARPWLERAVECAPADTPVFVVIGEMAVAAGAWEIAREYLERALAARQLEGHAHLVLGVLAVQRGDSKAADRHWDEAERIARKEHDQEALERVMMTRIFWGRQLSFRNPFGPLAGGAFYDHFLDSLDDEDDDDDF